MSDIPLHTLRRIGKTRAGYAPLNDAQENSTDMHTGVLRAAATRGANASLKGKGKQRERYIDADDFDEEATLLGNERALEDVEEGPFGEQSNGLRASSRVSGRLCAVCIAFSCPGTAFVDIEQDANVQGQVQIQNNTIPPGRYDSPPFY